MANLLYSTERRVRKVVRGRLSCTAALEQTLSRLQDASHGQFFMPRQIAEEAFGPHLQRSVPTSLLTHRLHDWVRYGSEITHTGDFFLSSADWGACLTAVAECAVLEEARQLQAADFVYRQTASFAHYLRCKAEGHPLVRNKVRLDTQAKVEAYFERFVALYESIAQHGFQTLRAARRLTTRFDRPSSVRGAFTAWGEKDLGIALSADYGAVLLPGGKHRLAIALVLGLPRIPVRVRMLHVSWLQQLGPVPSGQWLANITGSLVTVFGPDTDDGQNG